ncbi:hypothetical protein IODZLFCR_CDS0004 [Salmonella phage vB_SalP_SE29]|uniref:Uncharacterized protein n=1 Tax=Salmonella phage vB_SalP_SE29 TaxID=3134913 RepID=A0AAX4LXD2_9CAUD
MSATKAITFDYTKACPSASCAFHLTSTARPCPFVLLSEYTKAACTSLLVRAHPCRRRRIP